ncbi:MAG TPA: GNAT family N-acetyltransferase [Thermoplasmata archaeon]|nr:GNAT family N-acetyltransferase [Thermoplasmata archaeon]
MAERAAAADAALDAERRWVLALGGFALELPGATLVTHEKIPAPRFNFVVVRRIAPERQTSFFEHALDHYFQRALRPTFRVPRPVPTHLAAGLARFGFRRRAERLAVLVERPRARGAAPEFSVRPARDDEIESVASFWSVEKERPELRTALDIAVHHPNPDEALVPVVAESGGRIVAAALVYRHGRAAGIHLVSTRADARGRGAASALVGYVRRTDPAGRPARYAMFADSLRLRRRLLRLGFAVAREYAEFALPADAELSLPPPGPPGPPRWRPPRR